MIRPDYYQKLDEAIIDRVVVLEVPAPEQAELTLRDADR
jgi:hypothetical protein